MKRTMVVTAVLAAAFAAAAAPSAQAAKAKTKVTLEAIILTPDGTFYTGRIESSKRSCANERKVSVFMAKPGQDKKIGSDESQPGGMGTYLWQVRRNASPTDGTYYAKTGLTPKCKGDKSRDYVYD